MIVFTCENSTVPSSQLAINTCGLPSFPWLKYLNYDLSPLLAQDIQYREVTWRPNFMSFAVCQNYITYLKNVCQQANAGFLSEMQSVTTSVIHRKLPLGLKYFLEALWGIELWRWDIRAEFFTLSLHMQHLAFLKVFPPLLLTNWSTGTLVPINALALEIP